MSRITLDWIVSGQRVDAGGVTLADETDQFGIQRNDTLATVVAADTAVSHDALGKYSYDTSQLDPNVPYTAVWKVLATWGTEYIHELILPPVQGVCTLGDIERETAIRLGPYESRVCSDGSTKIQLKVGKLQSSLLLGGLDDRYILRRGYLNDGTPIVGFNQDDRQRIVVQYISVDGLIEIDRDYTTPPVVGEAIEIHYLDPETELRPLVLRALRDRAKIANRQSVRFPSLLLEQDIQALCPFVQQVNQLLELESVFTRGMYLPTLVNWWRAFERDGNIWATMQPTPFPFSALVYYWTYAANMVNGAFNADGPTDDLDILHVNPYYAASCAHVLSFLQGNVRPRIVEGARQGLFISQQMAVEEFERMAADHFRPRQKRLMVPAPGLEPRLIVNGPTLRQ